MRPPEFNTRRFGNWILLPLVVVGFVLSIIWPHARWQHDVNFAMLGAVLAYLYARYVG